jgi:hypothetical protein
MEPIKKSLLENVGEAATFQKGVLPAAVFYGSLFLIGKAIYEIDREQRFHERFSFRGFDI